jgi:hypothetical protein
MQIARKHSRAHKERKATTQRANRKTGAAFQPRVILVADLLMFREERLSAHSVLPPRREHVRKVTQFDRV